MVNDPLIGRQLANFRVERLLGSGGMAQVYYGVDIKLNRPVAIKVLDARYRDKPNYAQRFVQEARAVAQWRHDHILQVHYADDEGGLYYFVMEYVDGQDLASLMAQYTAENALVPHEDVVRIGRAVASALDYAHSQSVIHRDVKPGNVLIARSGRIALSDFGLAMDTQQGSLGQVFGTPHYISPEQARRSADAVPQSDLYSLGVILFEMLTGTVPFDDPSATSLALQHLTQAPPPPRSLNPELNAKTETVLLKALAKTPAERYDTGAEMMTALENALLGKTARSAAKATKAEKAAAAASAAATTSGRKLPPPPPGRFTPGTRSVSRTSIAEKVAAQPKAVAPAPVAQPQAVAHSTEPMQTPPVARMPTEPMKLTPTAAPANRWLGIGLMLGVVALLLCAAAWGLPVLYQNLTQNAGATPGSAQTPVNTVAAEATATTSINANTAEPKPSEVVPTTIGLSTEAPVATEILVATEAPVVTEAPSVTDIPVGGGPTATPTGNRFMLFYNNDGFYLFNASPNAVSISQMRLERLGPAGEVLNTFTGSRWAQFSATSKPSWCMAIEILESSEFTRPVECNKNGSFLTLSLRNLVRNDAAVFWTAVEGSQEFRVVWKEAEVGRCPNGTGPCEVYLP